MLDVQMEGIGDGRVTVTVIRRGAFPRPKAGSSRPRHVAGTIPTGPTRPADELGGCRACYRLSPLTFVALPVPAESGYTAS